MIQILNTKIIFKNNFIYLIYIIKKLIDVSVQHYGIKYQSKYNGTEDTLNLDLAAIEYKIHGNSQSYMIIYSGHINEIAHSIQNSKDILIDGINSVFMNYDIKRDNF